MTFYTIFTTIFCRVILTGDGQYVTRLHLDTGEGKRDFDIEQSWVENNDMLLEARKQIEEYCQGTLIRFTVPVKPQGTEFQKRVWETLCSIPYGEVSTYGQIAHKIGNDKSSRAVGAANGRNPIPLIIPCHRVIGADGSLTGFAHGLAVKEKLLNFERQQIIHGKGK